MYTQKMVGTDNYMNMVQHNTHQFYRKDLIRTKHYIQLGKKRKNQNPDLIYELNHEKVDLKTQKLKIE